MLRSITSPIRPSVTPLVTRSAVSLGLVGLVGLSACGAPPPKMVATGKDDGVPANSASEERLASDGKPKTTAAPAVDAAQPYTTPLNPGPSTPDPSATGGGAAGGGAAAGATGKGAGKGGKGPAGKDPAAKGGAKVTKAECRQTFEKFMDLNMSDPRLEGVPPEMLAQLKAQALQEAQTKQGDPCSTQEITRTQYTCAMSSTSSAAWQRCMK